MKSDSVSQHSLQTSSRRRLLRLSAGALATGLTGCVGNQSKSTEPPQTRTRSSTDTSTATASSSLAHESKSPPDETIETQDTGTSTSLAGEISLEVGQYTHLEFQLDEPTHLQITGVNEGAGTLDLFLLSPEREFEQYRNRERAVFSGGFATTDIKQIDRSIQISPGRYFLVFDNTGVYGATPQGPVTFEFKLVLESNPQTLTETRTETATDTPRGENNADIVAEREMPKIRTVTANFGHTFVWDPDEYHSDDSYTTTVEEELPVSDDTTVTLTVEELWAMPEDTLTFSYVFGSSRSSHPDNTAFDARIPSNSHTWDMRREDYTSEWRFQIFLRNDDDIYYQNDASQSDFKFTVYYNNLTLE